MEKCSHCGTVVKDNDKFFCPNCGKAIDKNLELVRNIEKVIDNYKDVREEKHKKLEKSVERFRNSYDDDNIQIKKYQPEKTNPLIIVVIVVLVIFAFVMIMVLK